MRALTAAADRHQRPPHADVPAMRICVAMRENAWSLEQKAPMSTICPQCRRAVEADVPAIMAIRFAVRENVLSDPSRVTPEMCIEYLDAAGRGWVCELDGRIVGFSYAARADASIWALFVLPQYEGRGVGTALLGCAVDWLFGLGHDTLHLSTDADTRADRFYRARGWQRGAMKDGGEVRFHLPRPSRR
jgi:GNAT superfamily N-acetyltransferase